MAKRLFSPDGKVSGHLSRKKEKLPLNWKCVDCFRTQKSVALMSAISKPHSMTVGTHLLSKPLCAGCHGAVVTPLTVCADINVTSHTSCLVQAEQQRTHTHTQCHFTLGCLPLAPCIYYVAVKLLTCLHCCWKSRHNGQSTVLLSEL